MAKSENDYNRNKFDRVEDYNYREDIQERRQHRRNKRMTNAIRSKDIDALYDLDED